MGGQAQPARPCVQPAGGCGAGPAGQQVGKEGGDGGAALTQCGDGPSHGGGKRTVDKGLESVAPGKW